MASRVVTVNDVLDGHVALDVECLDRIYLNGYVPNLQVGGQVVSRQSPGSVETWICGCCSSLGVGVLAARGPVLACGRRPQSGVKARAAGPARRAWP